MFRPPCSPAALLLGAAAAAAPPFTHPLDSLQGLEALTSPADLGPEVVSFRGRRAVRVTQVTPPDDAGARTGAALMLRVPEVDFEDGTLEVDVVGRARPGAPADVRGFVGLAFRVQEQPDRYECVYIRHTNGRADDQVRRNHSTQYISSPEWGWKRLRDEMPAVYESYVDLAPDAWTHLRVRVAGTRAELYVGNAPQPVLLVKDLKHGRSRGRVALWVGTDTEAYFSRLKIAR